MRKSCSPCSTWLFFSSCTSLLYPSVSLCFVSRFGAWMSLPGYAACQRSFTALLKWFPKHPSIGLKSVPALLGAIWPAEQHAAHGYGPHLAVPHATLPCRRLAHVLTEVPIVGEHAAFPPTHCAEALLFRVRQRCRCAALAGHCSCTQEIAAQSLFGVTYRPHNQEKGRIDADCQWFLKHSICA